MSFSGTVKEELSRQISTARHCRIAETARAFKPVRQVYGRRRAAYADGKFCSDKKILYISPKNI